MNIAGFLKSSTIDYRGHLAAVVYRAGCTLRCPYCHNAKLVTATANTMDASVVVKYIREHADTLDGVVITGGEPMCADRHELMAFMGELSKYVDVKLDTNGTIPMTYDDDKPLTLWEPPSKREFYIAMDLKGTEAMYRSGVFGIYAQFDIYRDNLMMLNSARRQHGRPAEVRTTIHRRLLDENKLLELAEMRAQLAPDLDWFWQPFRDCECFDPTLHASDSYKPDELLALADKCNAIVRR